MTTKRESVVLKKKKRYGGLSLFTNRKRTGADMLMDFLSKKIQCLWNNDDPDLTSASFPYSGADPSTDQINLPGDPGLREAICHEKEETIPTDVFLLWNRILG